MTAERCGIGSLLPVSCRGRAEAFARRLQHRLRSLGRGETDDDDTTPGPSSGSIPGERDELLGTWSNNPSNSTCTHEPMLSPDTSDRFYDFDIDIDDSGPGSPVNEEDLGVNTNDGFICCESGCDVSSPIPVDIDSSESSDTQYYDPCSDVISDSSGILVPAHPSSREDSNSDFTVSSDTLTSLSQNSLLQIHDHEINAYSELNNDDIIPIDDSCQCQDNNFSQLNNEEELSTINDNSSSIQNNDDNYPSIETDFEIRQCVEKLCTEIIAQAEAELITIKKQQKEIENNAECLSPKVIISRVESLDQPQEECITKSKEEINTLFECLNLREPTKDSSHLSTPEDELPRRVQRSSSLKTGKTPPGTPGRKKIVRFADVLGLDLADVRTFMDDIPKVPSCAFWDLHDDRKRDAAPPQPTKCLVPMFQQPVCSPKFLDKVKNNKVSLENAFQGDSLSISGTVRVLNIDFHKSVYIRYSLDNWENFADLQASYVPGSSDGFSDKFSFVLYGHTLDIGQRLEFAVKFNTGGQQFWDSNNGSNYVFQCLSSTLTPVVQTGTFMEGGEGKDTSSQEDDTWASFY